MPRAGSHLFAVLLLAAGCRIGEHIAEPPIDAGGVADDDAGDEGDGGGGPDAEDAAFHGLVATIGERPEWSGTCDSVSDRAEITDRFDPAVQQQQVSAGWDFDTGADSYDDPTYGFMPNWPAPAESGRFSLRLTGTLALPAGTHCFSIDIGATGTDIIGGKNMCAQIWLGTTSTAPAVVSGFGAPSVDARTACVDIVDGEPIMIVYWYFNIFEQAKLQIRHCAGAGCTPSTPLSADDVRAE